MFDTPCSMWVPAFPTWYTEKEIRCSSRGSFVFIQKACISTDFIMSLNAQFHGTYKLRDLLLFQQYYKQYSLVYIVIQRAYTNPLYHLTPWEKVLNGVPWNLIHCEGKHWGILDWKCPEKHFKALKRFSSSECTNAK